MSPQVLGMGPVNALVGRLISEMLAGKDSGKGPERKFSPALRYSRFVSAANREGGILPVSEFWARARTHRLGILDPQVLGMDPVNVLSSINRDVRLDEKVVGNRPVNKLL